MSVTEQDIVWWSGLSEALREYLAERNLTNINPLKNLINLQKLTLENNNITDISGLKNLINLQDLLLSQNNITDISVLVNLTA